MSPVSTPYNYRDQKITRGTHTLAMGASRNLSFSKFLRGWHSGCAGCTYSLVVNSKNVAFEFSLVAYFIPGHFSCSHDVVTHTIKSTV